MPKIIERTYSVVTHTVVTVSFEKGQEPENLNDNLALLVADRIGRGVDGCENMVLCKELISEIKKG